eukprot:tig00020911_g15722.t1
MRAAVTTSPCRSLALVRWRHDGAQGFLRDSRSDRSGWRKRDAPFADRSKFVSELARKSALFVPCPPGLEAVLEREIREIGVDYELKPAAYRRGVYVQESLRRAIVDLNLRLRVATRVLVPLRKPFPITDVRSLYAQVRRRPPRARPAALRSLAPAAIRSCGSGAEDRLVAALRPGASDGPSRGGGRLRTLAVRAAVYNNDAFINDMYAAQVCKDAIVDQARRLGLPAFVSVDLFVDGRTAVLSLDTSGSPCSSGVQVRPRSPARAGGGRVICGGGAGCSGGGALQESLAAGLLMLARYAGPASSSATPCAGARHGLGRAGPGGRGGRTPTATWTLRSGTILVEAAMMATRTPPAPSAPVGPSSAPRAPRTHRRPADLCAGQGHPGYTPGLLERARAEAGRRGPGALGRAEARIMGADASKEMVEAARANLRAAGFGPQLDSGAVRVERAKLEEYQPRPPPDLVLTNPPRGAGRAEEDLPALYKQLGDFLKQRTAKRRVGDAGCVFVGSLWPRSGWACARAAATS